MRNSQKSGGLTDLLAVEPLTGALVLESTAGPSVSLMHAMNLQESGNGGHPRRTSLQDPPGGNGGSPRGPRGSGRHLLDMLPGLLDGAERVGGGPRASQQLLRDARLQVEAVKMENELLKVSMA